MRYVFIINPVAGKGKGHKILPDLIRRHFGGSDNFEIYVTEHRGHAGEIAAAAASRNDDVRIYACGGEGTFFEVINSVIKHNNVSVGVIPCGSANDFIKFFGDKEDFLDIDSQLKGRSIEIDAIKADEFYCINSCSVGMDAVVADNMHIFKKWPLVTGSIAYKMALVKTFLGKTGMKLRLSIDGQDQGVGDYLFAVCANGPIYGGGYKSAPKAVPFDGRLNYTVVGTVPKKKMLRLVKLYELGLHEGIECCTSGECMSFSIECDRPMPINLDGEIIHRKKISFSIEKSVIRFILPAKIAEKFETKSKVLTV